MTHAECQDLLLDLAYGEIDPPRAVEVKLHLDGCDDCRKEKEALDKTRKLVAPLGELDEPSESFDARILAAARAEAALQTGQPGKVIEASFSARPAEVTGVRVETHAKGDTTQMVSPSVASLEKRRPRWAMRFAVGGSIAAAAALALIVTGTQNRAPQAQTDAVASYKIAPKAPAAPAPVAVAEAPPPESKAAAEPTAYKKDRDESKAPRKKAAPPSGNENLLAFGGGGDIGDSLGEAQSARLEGKAKKEAAKDEEASALQGAKGVAGLGTMGAGRGGGGAGVGLAYDDRKQQAPPQPKREPVVEQKPAPAPPPPPPAAAAAPEKRELALDKPADGYGSGAASPKSTTHASKAVAAAPRPDEVPVEQLESTAANARRQGNYALAAGLYRKAAALRAGKDDHAAAWDLAHAAECLAAVGNFDAAREVVAELANLKAPPEPMAAAERAVRPAQMAQPAEAEPAAKAAKPAAEPAMKAKSRPSTAVDF